MKAKDFKRFREAVIEAQDSDPIWYAGYLWLDLTAKQCDDVYDILITKGMGRLDEQGKPFAMMPSGLQLRK